MKRTFAFTLSLVLLSISQAQTPQNPPPKEEPQEIIRITTNLVQTDAVVMDKNDQLIKDLKLEDFELYDNGKRQEIKFLEFVGVDTGKRVEIARPALPPGVEAEGPSSGVSTANLKRVIALVVDDLTISYGDLARVRDLLLDFVNNQMRGGDLVGIVSVIGNSGLLQQYTADKQLLRRAIQRLTPKSHPLSVNGPAFSAADAIPTAADDSGTNAASSLDAETQTDDINKGFRSLMGLATTNSVITSLRSLPGRKTVVFISGGLPLYESNEQGLAINRSTGETIPVEAMRPLYGNIASLIHAITDNASRSGVVVNTMDVRGLQGAARFRDTEAKSALGMTVGSQSAGGGGMDPTFGRTPNMALVTGPDELAGAQGLRELANSTGGIASVNTNNFRAGLDKILTRSEGYYLLGYSPSEAFDAKFHKISIKVRREGAHVYTRSGYIAREDAAPAAATAKEDMVMKAALSPLVRTELGVSTLVQHKFTATDKADLDIHIFIDPKTLHFTQSPEGRYRDSFDVVGFVFNALGKELGGFSQTVNANLTPERYQSALATGFGDWEHTELPPGYFQLRVVVRENETGRVGTTSRYLEVPNLEKKQLTASSLFIYAVDPTQQGAAGITPLRELRQISRKQVLRYAAIVYNSKTSGGQPELHAQAIVSQDSKVLFQQDDPLKWGASTGVQIIGVGELLLAKVRPGRYLLTLIVNDANGGRKAHPVARSIDFTVVD